jgi:hypothetical protein
MSLLEKMSVTGSRYDFNTPWILHWQMVSYDADHVLPAQLVLF